MPIRSGGSSAPSASATTIRGPQALELRREQPHRDEPGRGSIFDDDGNLVKVKDGATATPAVLATLTFGATHTWILLSCLAVDIEI